MFYNGALKLNISDNRCYGIFLGPVANRHGISNNGKLYKILKSRLKKIYIDYLYLFCIYYDITVVQLSKE